MFFSLVQHFIGTGKGVSHRHIGGRGTILQLLSGRNKATTD
ncbi:Uncharacterised protein [Vibrio cholerae]|uniref:Uncharacterized protein n=1 Tax=Vibrio cholerae TaxID=666 RepID=A0A655Y9R2_VIBCL|nr:Uncharacterised protein [Vibrio cholerae]CSB90179.1 Uncharacterised protein [Vibrio cholerae]CSC33085.1 Uncharacterised protein [Vibrio cholerae]